MNRPLVCAIVITYNGRNLIERMLKSLEKTIYPNLKIVVVDNGSTDGSSELVKTKFPDLDLLKLEKNVGFGGGNNLATKYALNKYNPDYVLWLNDDMEIVDAKWLDILLETAERRKSGIIGCKLVLPDGRVQYAGGFFHPFKITYHRGLFEIDNGQYDDEIEVDYVNGACFLISRSVIDQIGFLDPAYYPIYFEEADYCARAHKNRFPIFYTGKTKLVHYTSTTAKKDGADRRYYIWEKNRLHFINKHFPIIWKFFSYLRILIGVLWVDKNSQFFGTSIFQRFSALRKALGSNLDLL